MYIRKHLKDTKNSVQYQYVSVPSHDNVTNIQYISALHTTEQVAGAVKNVVERLLQEIDKSENDSLNTTLKPCVCEG